MNMTCSRRCATSKKPVVVLIFFCWSESCISFIIFQFPRFIIFHFKMKQVSRRRWSWSVNLGTFQMFLVWVRGEFFGSNNLILHMDCQRPGFSHDLPKIIHGENRWEKKNKTIVFHSQFSALLLWNTLLRERKWVVDISVFIATSRSTTELQTNRN